MPSGVTVAEAFAAASLIPSGPVHWDTRIDETRSGVYVLSVTSDPDTCFGLFDLPSLPPHLAANWLAGEPIVYIGRTRRALRIRLREFYRHQFGQKRPHKGGEAALLINPKPLVFWATTTDPVTAERMMIDEFHRRVGRLPFANRCRGSAARI